MSEHLRILVSIAEICEAIMTDCLCQASQRSVSSSVVLVVCLDDMAANVETFRKRPALRH